ncbi:MAG TPA: hypothetical protein VHB21_09410 [Minicystis sp.]|nr:hypothetical protein [Minicystis sp.]
MRVRSTVTIALVLGLSGCVGPYTVREQRSPNPFAGSEASFAVMPLDWSRAYVDPGPPTNVPWNDDDRAEFEHAKRAMNGAFQRELVAALRRDGIGAHVAGASGAHDAAFAIRPVVLEVTPGDFSGGPGHPATHVRVGAAIVDRGGQVLDVVEVEHDTLGDPLASTLDQRFTLDGGSVGERVAAYVHGRVVPGSELR